MSIWDSKQASRKSRLKRNIVHEALHDFVQPDYRTIYINDREANSSSDFKGNSISTTKYNAFTFVPKGLFEQFRRVANVYFLLIAILSATPISPIRPETNIGPLVLVLSVSLIKEAFEDWKRFKHDREINLSLIEVLQGTEWVKITWSELSVGDIVRVKSNQYFPADLLFLASTNVDGNCYVETSNLDGESNLKIKKALEQTWDCVHPNKASIFKGVVKCERPNGSLHTFTGNLIICKETLSLSIDQVLLRGCSLHNTEQIVGAVIYAGPEAKIMMNSLDVPSKRSTLERKLDKLIYILFAILFLMCLTQAVGCAMFLKHRIWYLRIPSHFNDQFGSGNRFTAGVLTFLTLITLYNTLIPISLYVSLEIIKFVQSTQFINKDLNMYHPGSNTRALARTSNLNEELGQVEYVFSDKTGTLTQNLMEFFKCSIGGQMYGVGMSEVQRAVASQIEGGLEEEKSQEEDKEDREFNFFDSRLLDGKWKNEPTSETCKEFFRCLAICHSVLPECEETQGNVKYQASSPDEAALVTAAKNFGFFFFRRTPKSVIVRETHVEKHGCSKDVEYQILNILEFNSIRKRQSVVCWHPDGRLVLYCKGADEIIFERLADNKNDVAKATLEHLKEFASDGLRSLCMAYRELDIDLYNSWNEKFIRAKSALDDRESHMNEVAELIEQSLILLGCTAIEDKLQEGVPECMEMLTSAGIKIWVLTGDKLETAMNIAYACKVLSNDMQKIVISSEAERLKDLDHRDEANIEALANEVRKQLTASLSKAEDPELFDKHPHLAVVIDGKCLLHALDSSLRDFFLKLCLQCKAVVCCRVSPLQKAQVTSLMKYDARKITLSIGDGANDVSMIQAAHIGVAIRGQEGMQAVMASDFAIAQFRFLTDLLLVHGRWSYFRMSKVVIYFLYKNITLTMVQFWFNFYNGYSGERFYDDWSQTLYNVFFTALPVIIFGLFEMDVNATISKRFPQLYRSGIADIYFRWQIFFIWLFFAILQSVVIFYFTILAGSGGQNSHGKTFGLWDIGTMAFTFVVITVNVRLLMECNLLTVWHHISIWGSILSWFGFILIYSSLSGVFSTEGSMVGEIYVLGSTWYFWTVMLLVTVATLLGPFLYQGIQRWIAPYDYQILQEALHRFPVAFSSERKALEQTADLKRRLLEKE